MDKPILISEIFGPVLQGEGALIGKPTVFVRTGGCDFKCSWCDSLYAVLPEFRGDWRKMTAPEILQEVKSLSGGQPILITLSGGNPALQPLEPMLDLGRAEGFSFALETQGSHAQSWFSKLDFLVLSPKGPSSGMTTDWDALSACVAAAKQTFLGLKIVVFDEADYEFARNVAARFPKIPIYLQTGMPPNSDEHALVDIADIRRRLEWLLRRVAQDGWQCVTILPQLHVLLWGRKRGK